MSFLVVRVVSVVLGERPQKHVVRNPLEMIEVRFDFGAKGHLVGELAVQVHLVHAWSERPHDHGQLGAIEGQAEFHAAGIVGSLEIVEHGAVFDERGRTVLLVEDDQRRRGDVGATEHDHLVRVYRSVVGKEGRDIVNSHDFSMARK